MPMFLEVTMLNVSGAALGYDVCKTQRRDTGFDGVAQSAILLLSPGNSSLIKSIGKGLENRREVGPGSAKHGDVQINHTGAVVRRCPHALSSSILDTAPLPLCVHALL